MLLLLLALGCGSPTPPDWRPAIDAWRAGDPLPDVPLVDQEGRHFDLGRTRGAWLVLGFVYTRCPKSEACPMTMTKLVALDAASQAVELNLLAVTLDPAWDTPERLKAFGERHGVDFTRFTLATGEAELVSQALPSLFNVVALPGEAETLDHTVRIALVDPEGRTVGKWSDEAITSEAVLARIAPPVDCTAGRLHAAPDVSGPFAGAEIALCAHGEETWGLVTNRPGWGGPVAGETYTVYSGTPVRVRRGAQEDGQVVHGVSRWAPGQLEREIADGAWSRELSP
ncbi:MAG: redoxin domain-containing protein [Deltaproteobacteria bacterium]|nr:MAG: redoxin domain-containing protein [Deltaproteobacteria bacterium]